VAVAAIAVAVLYEVTPWKRACLVRCRGPLSFLMSSWRDGRTGALRMGFEHAAWCLGCCWALMVVLVALGAMSMAWMGVVAGLVALEKLIPGQRVAEALTTAALVVLAVLLLAAPGALPAMGGDMGGSMGTMSPAGAGAMSQDAGTMSENGGAMGDDAGAMRDDAGAMSEDAGAPTGAMPEGRRNMDAKGMPEN
jgi:hypothetical protein